MNNAYKICNLYTHHNLHDMINKSVIQQKGNEYAKNMTVCYSHIGTLQTAKMRVLN